MKNRILIVLVILGGLLTSWIWFPIFIPYWIVTGRVHPFLKGIEKFLDKLEFY